MWMEQMYIMDEKPNPWNNPAMKSLHDFTSEWTKRFNLDRDTELYYYSLLLIGRMEVAHAMKKIEKWKLSDEELRVLDL